MTPTCTIGAALPRCPNPFCDGRGDIDVSPGMTGRSRAPGACGVGPHPEPCSGPLAPIQLVPDEVLVAKYPHGAWQKLGMPWRVATEEQTNTIVSIPESHRIATYLSLDQLREAVTVGGKCRTCDGELFISPKGDGVEPCPDCGHTGREVFGCEGHRALVRPTRWLKEWTDKMPYGRVDEKWATEPPKLRLSDVLRVGCPRQCSHGLVRGCERDNEFVKWVPCRTCDGTGTIPNPALTEAMEWAERLGF